MAKYRKVDPRIWNDESGKAIPVSRCKLWMPYKNRLQSEVRRFVHARDRFACCHCGITADNAPSDYDGRRAISPLEVDHKVPQSRGGGHHPSNLQTLCQLCNVRKGEKVAG